MAYTKTVWKNGQAPALNEDNLNKIEQGIYDNDTGKIPKIINPTSGNFPSINSDGTISDSGISSTVLSVVSVPSGIVTLAASELAEWFTALPRLLTKQYYVYVTAGTVTQALDFTGFYGPGRIHLIANGEVTLSNGIRALWPYVRVIVEGFTLTGVSDENNSATVLLIAANEFSLMNCKLIGNGATYGIYAQAGSGCYVSGGSISGYPTAVDAIAESRVAVESVSCSNNTTGATVWGGGTILLSGSTPENLGSNSKPVSRNGLIFDGVRGLAVSGGGTGTTSVGGIDSLTLGFRGSKFATTDTNPGANNTICWTYS